MQKEAWPYRILSFCPKGQNDENEHSLAKFQILVKIAQNAQICQIFMLFHWGNKAFSPSWIFLIILLTFLEILKIPGFFVIFMKFP